MELCSNRAMLPQLLKGEPLELGKKHAFTTKQPAVGELAAFFWGTQQTVCAGWAWDTNQCVD